MTRAEDSLFCLPSYYQNQSFVDFARAGSETGEEEVFILPPPPAPPKPRLRADSDVSILRVIKNTRSVASLNGRSCLPPPVPFRSSSLRRHTQVRSP